MLTIRPYRPADWPRLQEIHDPARRNELALAGMPDAFRPLAEVAEEEGLFDYPHLDVAEVNGTAAGFAAYTDEELARREIPVLAMLGAKPHQLREKAGVLCAMLEGQGVRAQVVSTQDQVGGGSVPTQLLDAWAVAIDPGRLTVDQLEEKLRLRPLPIIGRITHEQYILDVRTLMERDFPYIARTAGEVVK